MKKRFTMWGLVAMLSLLVMALVGCGNDAGKGGTKTIRLGGTSAVTASIDPAKDWEGWYTVRFGVAETLFKLDKTLSPVPWLAIKGEQVNGTTWKITLNDKAIFSNGTKVTPEKVIASLKRAGEKNSRAKVLKEANYSVEGNSIIVQTKEPQASFIYDLTDPYAAIIDVEGTKDFDKAPIGTGPFVVTSFEPNKKAVLAKNAKYWDGAVKSEQVEFVNIADFNTLALAVQNGEVDIALAMSPQSAESAAKSDKLTIAKTVQPRAYILYFHMEKMTDKAVREAIVYGVDKKTIGDKQLKGAVTPANGAFLDNSDYGAKNLKVREYNEAKAKEVLAAAGYKDTDQDGIVEKDGKPLVIKLSIYKRLAMESIATEMQAQLKKIGIKVEIDVHEKASYMAPGNFEVALYSMITTPTGDPYASLYDIMGTGRASNFGRYSSAVVDGYLADMSNNFNAAERIALAEKIQQVALDDAAYAFIGFNNMHTAISKSISGYETSANDYYQMTKDVVKK